MRWLLSMLCRSPERAETVSHAMSAPAAPLALLEKDFPLELAAFRGKRLLDFGSGWGFQSVAVAKLGADVLALEMVAERRDFTLAEAKKAGVTLRSEAALPAQDKGQFDFVLSLDAMEHYSDPAFILKEMHLALRPGGRLLLSFGPPWYSPYGAHLRFMSPVPWIHLFFSENALMEERRRFRSDGARKFSEVEGGMNQMTVGRFERMLGNSGFSIERKKMKCVYRMNFLGWIPLVRELFVNEVSVVAVKRS